MTSGAGTATGWGAEVVQGTVDGHPCRMYADRRAHVPELLFLDAARWAERTYLVSGERRITFAAHQAAVLRVAAALADRGVGRGDRVLFLAGNQVEWVVGFWAVLRLGAVVVGGNAWWSPAEAARCVAEIDPALVLTDAEFARLVPDGVPTVRLESFRPLVDTATPPPVVEAEPPHEDDPALILFTSGTTGAAKGVVLSHRSVIANQQSILVGRGRLPSQLPAQRPGPVSLVAVPLFHIGGIQAILTGVLAGGSLVFTTGRFDPAEVLRLIEAERVTVWSCVPTMLLRVLDHPDRPSRDLTSVRSVNVTGAPVRPELVDRARRAFPKARRGVGTVYGGTECGGVVTSAAGDDLVTMPGYVGRPLPVVEMRIADPDPGGLGEILVRSPSVMTGYWGRPDDAAVDTDGWLHTGDLGRKDDQDRVFVVDRIKDVIIRGGENVAAPHVEECLRAHVGVVEVAVLGLPHPDLGEEVAAVVVTRGAVTEQELAAHAAERLGRFQVPTAWWLRTEPLPVNPTGKVLKRKLREDWPG